MTPRERAEKLVETEFPGIGSICPHWIAINIIEAAIQSAVEAEREGCAAFFDRIAMQASDEKKSVSAMRARMFAVAIRARKP